MAAFDTALTPVAATPANTSNATLFTASADSSVLITAANLSAVQVAVRIGITPSGGAVHWLAFDVVVPGNDSIEAFGPFFLKTGDAVTVRTAVANDITFALTGVRTS